VECTSECCKKWDWRVCKVNWCVVRGSCAWRECGSSVSESETRAREWVKLEARMLELGRELGSREWDWELGFCRVRVWGQRRQAWVRVWICEGVGQLKTHFKKSPTVTRAALPPGGRSQAARRYTSKMPLDLFFWYGARRVLGSRQAACFCSASSGQFHIYRLAGGNVGPGDYCSGGDFCVFGYW